LKKLFYRLAKKVKIAAGARLKGFGNIRFGRSVRIEAGCQIDARDGSVTFGDGVTLSPFVIIESRGGCIEIGEGTSINHFSVLYGHGGLKIGKKCLIASKATFIPANHVYDDPNVLIKKQGETRKGITVGDDVWIGTGVTVLDGVTIGDGCVIGAGSVVTKSLPAYCVAVGVPARAVKSRGKNS